MTESKNTACCCDAKWELEITYTTGDSEKSYREVECLAISWRSKELAKQAMKEILLFKKMGNSLDHQNKQTLEVCFDWMVFSEDGYLLSNQMQFEMDDGSRKALYAFWQEDVFTYLEKMRIVKIEVEEEDDCYIF